MSNLFLLWRQVLKNPRSLGTIAPSSKYLAQTLVSAANVSPSQRVVEIGAGTGPLTNWIWDKVDPKSFLVLEPNPEMARALRSKFKGIEVSEEVVQNLEVLCKEKGWEGVDSVLSSLPWSLFPEEVLNDGLKAIHQSLAPNGKVLTLVYSHAQYFPASLHLEKKFHEHFENVYRTRTTWRNIPPGYWLVGERPRKRINFKEIK
jgi:phosphatidylethanolamine/phosphatidyl-N-methylethanolamine N-methyltransferase